MRLLSTAIRSPQAWWRTSAAAALGGATLAGLSGHVPLAVVLAVWAIVSLYGSVDHLVEAALTDLLEVTPAAAPTDRTAALDRARPASLPTRQRRVLRLLAYGLTEDEIADLLNVGPSTVSSDVDQVLAHLGVADTHQAIDLAFRTEFADDDQQGREARPAA